eukprot:TRINITY_DN13075_c0_g1_i1.p3 TRINITY_DN13075_c0_g1~~TRINITY_DN13075_c0_g1_i1.p3  ORF type:complete len:153 (-),score=23.53 TRINITY_DN13075_c0_g1_i1:206-610(-)
MDTHPQCQRWSQLGQCEENPGFMLKSCPVVCGKCGRVLLGVNYEQVGKEKSTYDSEKYKKGATFVLAEGVSRYPPGSRILKSIDVQPGQKAEEEEEEQEATSYFLKQREYLLVPMMYVQEERYTVYFWFESSDD